MSRISLAASIVMVGATLSLAACQSGDMVNSPGQERDTITEAELYAYCPPVTLREGTAFHYTYEGSDRDDPSKLVYQAAISDVTRTCSHTASGVTINVAVAGRIVPGPAGKAGTATMPIRIVAVQGEAVLYSELHQYQVAVNDAAGATQFIFNDPNVSLPVQASSSIQLFAGYDEGPYD